MRSITNIISVSIVFIITCFNYTSNVWAGSCDSCSSDSCGSVSRGACVNGTKTGTQSCSRCDSGCNPPSSYWGCSPALGGICDNGYLGFRTYSGGWTNYPTTTCQVCGNGYKEGTEQCDDSNVTNGDGCSSICVTEYIDIGLKYFDGTSIIKIAVEPTGTVTSPLRIAKNGTIYGIVLVVTTDPMASKFIINTSSGVKALRKI